MNWYIGQEIVCIKTHSSGLIKEGQIFTIKGLRAAWCKCNYTQIDIGFSDGVLGLNRCGKCKIRDRETTLVNWFTETMFKPLDELADISELTEHLETTQPFDV